MAARREVVLALYGQPDGSLGRPASRAPSYSSQGALHACLSVPLPPLAQGDAQGRGLPWARLVPAGLLGLGCSDG